MEINVVVPMAGRGSRFVDAGYAKPKPFIDINGRAMIEHVLENLWFENARFILICQAEHKKQEPDVVARISASYDVEWIEIDHETEGTACTVLKGHRLINNETALIIANSDQIVDVNIWDFVFNAQCRDLAGSIMCFENHDRDHKWSYAKLNSNNFVEYVREKEPISVFATVGIYYFSKGCEFVNSALDMIIQNERVNNEFYTCPTYNYLIRYGNDVGIWTIEKNLMHGLGTPDDLTLYLTRNR